MPHPRVAVLILGFNHRATLEACIDSVLKQSRTPDLIRYIDNASTDDSVVFVQQQFPAISVQINKLNIGYAGGYKNALAEVFQQDFDAAILLNPDTLVDARWFETLVTAAFADDTVALAQPKIYLYDAVNQTKTNHINTFGNHIHFLGFGYCGRYNELDEPPIVTNQSIVDASGACLLVKKSHYQQLAGLDESFFAYLEDQDLNWQVQEQGFKILCVADSLAWHQYDFEKKNLANSLKFYLLERNRLTFLLKHFETKTLLLIAPAFCVMECGMLVDALLRGYFRAKLKSYWDFLKYIPHTLQSRKIIQDKRTQSDRELFAFLSPTIEFEAVDSPLLRLANRFLKWYYRCIKRWI
ncbi:MAG: glycosyltransferase family 2 protein [Candidatus Moraniibacteriota bacterium]